MKKKAITLTTLALSALILMSACQRRAVYPVAGGYRVCEPVIEQEYVHKYGLTMEPQEWQQRGQSGRVISKRADGVTICQEYDNGSLHGECYHTFPHCETIEKKMTYQQGRLVEDECYYRSGVPQNRRSYLNDGEGVSHWYEDGTPKSVEKWVNGGLVYGEYYDRNHTLEARVDNGEGVRVSRDIYGQLISHDQISNGQVTQTKTFHPNGNPREITSWYNGQRHGLRKQYLPDGEPLSEEQWHAGRQHGQTIYYLNGERNAVVTYQNGKKDGVEERYKDNDHIVERINWRNGEKHGLSQRYLDNGIIKQWYLSGKPVTQDEFEMQTYYTVPQR